MGGRVRKDKKKLLLSAALPHRMLQREKVGTKTSEYLGWNAAASVEVRRCLALGLAHCSALSYMIQ